MAKDKHAGMGGSYVINADGEKVLVSRTDHVPDAPARRAKHPAPPPAVRKNRPAPATPAKATYKPTKE